MDSDQLKEASAEGLEEEFEPGDELEDFNEEKNEKFEPRDEFEDQFDQLSNNFVPLDEPKVYVDNSEMKHQKSKSYRPSQTPPKDKPKPPTGFVDPPRPRPPKRSKQPKPPKPPKQKTSFRQSPVKKIFSRMSKSFEKWQKSLFSVTKTEADLNKELMKDQYKKLRHKNSPR